MKQFSSRVEGAHDFLEPTASAIYINDDLLGGVLMSVILVS